MNRAALLLLAASGCDYVTSSLKTNDFSGDAYPILVDRSAGGVVVGMREGSSDRTAVLDVMSPLTLIDKGGDVRVSIAERDLTLLGARSLGAALDLPRARFPEKTVATLHPCQDATCSIGTPGALRPFDALFGLDSFAGDALRLRLGDDQIFVLPDIAGSEVRRGRACDAFFESPYRGGGTLVIAGTELDFSNFRVAIDTCIAPNPIRDTPQSKRGADALLVASTAIGISILDESTYERYRELDSATIPDLATLPDDTVYLPSGPITGKLASIPSLALVSNLSANPRAPCRQVWASHLMAARDCAPGDDCPCTGGSTYCSAPAIVELAPAAPATTVPILVVSDAAPILQALRAELRPDRPEVDGILGADILTSVELDLDYTHDRMLARCTNRDACSTRTFINGDTDERDSSRFYVNGCLGDRRPPDP
ncbi:MAG TPA: hypothetical protein VMZ53_15505 [Kofleriaceae bacterium]|nr:hypothetical protein [Kofleriaceae bacterium]